MTTAYDTFLADPNREDTFLVELYPYDPSTGTTTTLRYADRPFRTEPGDTPASTPYVAVSDFVYSYSAPTVPAGTLGLLPSGPGGVIELGQKFGALDSLANYTWDGRRCVIKHGGTYRTGTLAFSDYQTIRDAEIDNIKIGLDVVRIDLRDKDARFDFPVERRSLPNFGDCLQADGAKEYVDFGTAAKLKLLNALDIECWILPYQVSGTQHILGYQTNGYRLYLDSSGHLNVEWKKSAATVTKTSAFTFVAKYLYHLGVTVTDTAVNFYIYDYAADSTTTETFTGTGFTGRDTPGLGEHFCYFLNYGGSNYFKGQIRQVRIYNAVSDRAAIEDRRFRILTSTEQTAGSLIQYVDFSDGTGTTVTDKAPSAANGTIVPVTTGPASLSATATSNYFSRSTGSFVTDGWVAGMIGISSGFSNGANNGTFRVTTVAATQLTVSRLTLVTEGPTASCSLTGELWRPTLTGLLTGESENQGSGQTCPAIYGKVFNTAPLLVDELRQIYIIHVGQVNAVNFVFHGGYNDITAGTTYTAIDTFLANDTASAHYDVLKCPIGTYLRLGSAPTLPVTCDVQGDYASSTYVYTAADIVDRLVKTRGPSPLATDEVNSTAVSDLNTANSAVVGIVCGGDTTIKDAVNQLLSSVGAAAWFGRTDGKLTMARFEGAASGTPVLSLTENDVEESLDSLQPALTELPVWELIIQYKKNWTVMDSAQLAAATKGTWRYGFSLSEWRKIRVANQVIQDTHSRARSMVVPSLLTTYSDAATEAVRLRALYEQQGQAFDVVVRNRALQLDRFDVVTFYYRGRDKDNAYMDRFGLTSSTQFVVLGVDEDASSGTVKLSLWREAADPA